MATLLLSIMGSFAEFERALIRERQMEGIAQAKKRGVYTGRKKALTEEQVVDIRDRITAGETKSALAREYGVSRETSLPAPANPRPLTRRSSRTRAHQLKVRDTSSGHVSELRDESELWVGEDRVAALGVGLDPFEAVGVHNGAPVLVHHDRDRLLDGFTLAVLYGSLDGLHCGG